MRLVPGNLYSVLHRLLQSGLIAESDRRPVAGQEGVRRRYYTLTGTGSKVLRAEGRRLKSLVELAEDRRLLGPEEAI